MLVIFDTIMLSLLAASLLLWAVLAWQWFLLRSIVARYLTPDWPAIDNLVQFYTRQIFINSLLAQFERGRSLSYALCQVLPLQGLLGTVSGMIEVFNGLAQSQQGGELHQGISLALLSTFAGLAAAIPAIFCIFYLDRCKNSFRLRFQASYPIGLVIEKRR